MGRLSSTICKIIVIFSAVIGTVFCFVLAPTMSADAWNLQNILTHIIVPVVAVIDFFIVGGNTVYKNKDVLFVVLPPLYYAFFAGIGYVRNWQFMEGYNYPYFFLNWGSPARAFGFCKGLPFMRVMWWILALLLFLILVGKLYIAIVRKLHK